MHHPLWHYISECILMLFGRNSCQKVNKLPNIWRCHMHLHASWLADWKTELLQKCGSKSKKNICLIICSKMWDLGTYVTYKHWFCETRRAKEQLWISTNLANTISSFDLSTATLVDCMRMTRAAIRSRMCGAVRTESCVMSVVTRFPTNKADELSCSGFNNLQIHQNEVTWETSRNETLNSKLGDPVHEMNANREDSNVMMKVKHDAKNQVKTKKFWISQLSQLK